MPPIVCLDIECKEKNVTSKTAIQLDNYEKGLLIYAITCALSANKDISQDDIEKLTELKSRLQKSTS